MDYTNGIANQIAMMEVWWWIIGWILGTIMLTRTSVKDERLFVKILYLALVAPALGPMQIILLFEEWSGK